MQSPQVADNDPATLDVIESKIDGFEFQLQPFWVESLLFYGRCRVAVMSDLFSALDGEGVSVALGNRLIGIALVSRHWVAEERHASFPILCSRYWNRSTFLATV